MDGGTFPYITLVAVAVLLGFVAVYALWAVWAERKVSAFIQDRMGPMETGPYGSLQTVADILKLLLKEPIIPAATDKVLFIAAPVLIFAAIFAGFAVLPWAPGFSGATPQLGVLYVIAIISIDVIGILMAGWGSNNKYALYGAVRSIAQIISYEIPAGLALLTAIAAVGTLNITQIVVQQGVLATGIETTKLIDFSAYGGFLTWNIIQHPHLIAAFVIFFIAALAECNRSPFDIPEAESELVSGFHTEYGGFYFAVLFLAEYANMFLLSGLAVALFLGGWNSPIPNLSPQPVGVEHMTTSELFEHLQFARLTTGTAGELTGFLWGTLWTLTKILLLVLVMMWIRWTLPRLRADQLMTLCWKYLTPLSLITLSITIATKVLL